MAKKKSATNQPRVICDDCVGEGSVWSEASLAAWEDQTPWFDRVKMFPKPPESWRDRNCVRCEGAGYLDLQGRPFLPRLTDCGQRNVKRRRMEAGIPAE